MSDLLGQTEALLGFSVDLENKLSTAGLGGVGGAIERFVELRRALDGISVDRLDWAKNVTHELVSTLQGVAEQLEQLHAIKRALPDSTTSTLSSAPLLAPADPEPPPPAAPPSHLTNY